MPEQNWLAKYETLRDRPPRPDQLELDDENTVDAVNVLLDGDRIAHFYGVVGCDPPQDPRRNAWIFVTAWEAAHE